MSNDMYLPTIRLLEYIDKTNNVEITIAFMEDLTIQKAIGSIKFCNTHINPLLFSDTSPFIYIKTWLLENKDINEFVFDIINAMSKVDFDRYNKFSNSNYITFELPSKKVISRNPLTYNIFTPPPVTKSLFIESLKLKKEILDIIINRQ